VKITASFLGDIAHICNTNQTMNMKKVLLMSFMMMCGGLLMAQHTATLTGKANFKTQPDGMIKLDFTLDREMSEKEIMDTFQWLEDNDGLAVIQVDGVKVSLSILAEAADRNSFGKPLMFMGVDTWIVPVDGEKKTFDTEGLFKQFGL
jgi:hypothetical protein